MTRFFRFETLCFLALFTFLLSFGRERFFRDPGTFWHTKTGELILDSGTFLATDPYSYTFGGQPWTPYEWLGEIGMALLHRAGGFDTLLLVSVAIVAFTFAWLGGRVRETGLHPIAVGLLVILAVGTSANHFHVRPHLLSMLGIAGTMVALAAVESGRRTIRVLWWLVPSYAIWVNVHGGVLGGLATVGIAFACWLITRLLKWESPVRTWRDAGELSIIGMVLLLTPFVSPYGADIPKTWLAIMQMPEVRQIVVEHTPIDASKPENGPFLVLGFFYLILLAGLRQRPRATWLIPIVWFVMGCDRVRHISLFGIVALAAIAELFPKTVYAKWLAAKRPDYIVPPRSAPTLAAWIVPFFAIVCCFAFHVASVTIPVFGRGWARPDPTVWPMELLPVIRAEAEGRTAAPIFNEYNDGGFLIWYAPEFRVFVDDRCEVYGGEWLKPFVDAGKCVDTAKTYIEEQQKKYGCFDHALTRTDSGFDEYFKSCESWQCLGRTEKHAFYKRKPDLTSPTRMRG